MSNNVIVGSENIEGNITSCKIENQVKEVKKDSTFSIQKITTYMTYDVCNKEVIAEYKVPEFAGFAFGLPFMIIACLVFFVMIVGAISDF